MRSFISGHSAAVDHDEGDEEDRGRDDAADRDPTLDPHLLVILSKDLQRLLDLLDRGVARVDMGHARLARLTWLGLSGLRRLGGNSGLRLPLRGLHWLRRLLGDLRCCRARQEHHRDCVPQHLTFSFLCW
jgi:hypothetical protein